MEREVNGIRVHYEDGGTGPALVLLHGFPLTHEMWTAQWDALRDRARVIAPDLRGFGRTAYRDPVSIVQFADDVRALLAALDIDAAVICGHSMGGYVALRFVAQNPELVRGLVLVDTRAEADSPEAKQRRAAAIERVRREGAEGFLAEFAGNLVGPTTKERHPELVERVRALSLRAQAESVTATLQALADRPDSTGVLATIRVPTLIVHGEEDTVIPIDAARAMHERISGSDLVTIPAAGHTPSVERPEAFNDAVRAFLHHVETELPTS